MTPALGCRGVGGRVRSAWVGRAGRLVDETPAKPDQTQCTRSHLPVFDAHGVCPARAVASVPSACGALVPPAPASGGFWEPGQRRIAMAADRNRPDRVAERRRAVQLARHYREAEGLSITQIAQRLGRSPATVKAYFYDPTDGNKGLGRERVAKAGGRAVWSHLPAAAARGEILPRRTLLCARLGCPARLVGLGL